MEKFQYLQANKGRTYFQLFAPVYVLILGGTMGWLIGSVLGCRQAPTAPPEPKSLPMPAPESSSSKSVATSQQQDEFFPAPNFTVTDIDGKAHSLKDYAGKILIIEFWATYCKPCVQHLKEFNTYAAEFSRQGIEFLALSLDEKEAVIRGWRPEGFLIPLARLDDKTREAFLGKQTIVAIPQVRIIDRQGRIRYAFGPEAETEEIIQTAKNLAQEKNGGNE